MNCNLCRPLVLLALLVACQPSFAQDAAPEPADAGAVEPADARAAIEAASQAYVAAYNARDVDKLVSLWLPEGIYISRSSGEQIVGREAMKEEFTAIFQAEQLPTLAATTESIEFISPNVALERGAALVTRSEDDVVETAYRVVYVKQGGQWLIDRVTEDEIVTVASNYEHLQGLDWLVGNWVHSDEGLTLSIECKWTENQNFLSRIYSVSSAERAESSGLQIIGWDPNQKQIRSWLFDSNGGFISGTWTPGEDRWVVQSVATLADGGTGSFTSIFRPTEDGNYTWQKINRVIEGQLMPNIDEILVVRQ